MRNKETNSLLIWWLALMIFCLPLYLIRFKILAIPTTFLEINIYLFVLVSGTFYWPMRGEWWTRIKAVFGVRAIPIGLLVIGAIIGVLVSAETRASLGLFKAFFIDPLLLLIAMAGLVRSKRDVQKIIAALGLSVVAVGVVALLQYLGFLGSPEPWISEMPKRVSSVFEYPNAVSLYCLPIIGFWLGFIIFSDKLSKTSSWFYLLVVAFGFLAIYLAVSRGALLAFVLVGVIAGLFSKRKKLALVAVALAVLLVAGYAPMRSRISNLTNGNEYSTYSRVALWKGAKVMLKERWLTGVGLADFQREYEKVAVAEGYSNSLRGYPYPHNVFLNFWVSAGLLGLLGFLGLVGLVLVKCITVIRQRESNFKSALAGGVIVSIFMLILHGLVDAPYFKNDLSVLFWIIWILPFLPAEENESGN